MWASHDIPMTHGLHVPLREATCAGYVAYPFQNQEVNNQAGNLSATYLMQKLQRKRIGRSIMSTLFGNGYAHVMLIEVAAISFHDESDMVY